MQPSVNEPVISGQRRRPPSGWVIRNPREEERGCEVDWSGWYLREEDDMGEGGEQQQIVLLLTLVLRELARERGWERVHLGADQFFAWVKEEPLVRVSPDVYLLDDPPPPPLPAMWETWRAGVKPPRFAVEVVSGEWRKDYDDAPPKYAQLGCQELVIFDPVAAVDPGRPGERFGLQVYRREADGAFVRCHAGEGPASSRELGATLVITREGPVARLRLSRDPQGKQLVPTGEEARQEAERELERLRAEVGKLRGR